MEKLSSMPLLIINSTLYIVNYKLYIVHCAFYIFLLFATGCKQTTEPGLEAELRLEAEDVSCTEAWIKLTTANLQLPATVNVYRNDIVGQTFSLSTKDTVLYIDSLLPAQTYRIKTTIQTANQQISSNELTVTTMDTTSHVFTFQSFTFGEHSSSALYDVAIIDENNIWAVGEIYMLDSLGRPDPNAYNAVHWDGTKWELKRILYKGGFWTIRTIFGFSPNDIWFSGYVRYYNGQFIELPIPDILIGWGINKLWGSSSEDLYAVGNNGNIAHWDGKKWRKIESGTTVDLLDIWGSNYGTIWASGYTSDYSVTTLLRYDRNVWNKVYEGSGNNQNNNEYIGPISGVWTNNKFFTYVASWGKIYKQPNNNILNIKRLTQNFSEVAFSIRGTNHNNIFIVGQHGLIGHFNGFSYKEISELKNNNENFLKTAVKNNKAIVCGYNKNPYTGSRAVVKIITNN
jgi:hypothetical protein